CGPIPDWSASSMQAACKRRRPGALRKRRAPLPKTRAPGGHCGSMRARSWYQDCALTKPRRRSVIGLDRGRGRC
ncbi:MAG: hypothetical protein AVDCRST_MAG27-2740, partial [uncultured Craurococcus sp.]